jgi:hypothetical protein
MNSNVNHWNWKGGLVTKQCLVCRAEFTSKPTAKRKYCSLNCVYETTRGAPNRNSQWKGSDVSYSTLHAWVARWLGTPSECENCGTTTSKKFEWANVSKEYKRDLSDWKRLCHPCHIKFDDSVNKGVLTKKLRRVI